MFDKLTLAEMAELTSSEQKKIEYVKSASDNGIVVPILAVRWFCDVAFSLALRSCQTGDNVAVAKVLGEIFNEFIGSDLVSLDAREKLRTSISDARIDFAYATGNHNVASARLAPYLMRSK